MGTGGGSSPYRGCRMGPRGAISRLLAGLGVQKCGGDVVELVVPITEHFGVVRPDLRYMHQKQPPNKCSEPNISSTAVAEEQGKTEAHFSSRIVYAQTKHTMCVDTGSIIDMVSRAQRTQENSNGDTTKGDGFCYGRISPKPNVSRRTVHMIFGTPRRPNSELLERKHTNTYQLFT